MALNPNEKEAKDKMQKERRSFVKKAVYAAPKLIVLGYFLRPESSSADGKGSTVSGPSGPPKPW